jgi:hypothetical protein
MTRALTKKELVRPITLESFDQTHGLYIRGSSSLMLVQSIYIPECSLSTNVVML